MQSIDYIIVYLTYHTNQLTVRIASYQHSPHINLYIALS